MVLLDADEICHLLVGARPAEPRGIPTLGAPDLEQVEGTNEDDFLLQACHLPEFVG